MVVVIRMTTVCLRLEADRIYDSPLEARIREDGVMEFGVRTDHSQTRGSAKTATNNKNRKGATISRRRRTG